MVMTSKYVRFQVFEHTVNVDAWNQSTFGRWGRGNVPRREADTYHNAPVVVTLLAAAKTTLTQRKHAV